MENFTQLIESRYSVRKFTDEPGKDKDLEIILHAGHVAPTGCNNQPHRIYVIKSGEALEKLKECTRCHFDSKTVLLVTYKKDECWYRPYDKEPSGMVDASIVTTHMMLAAWEIGVGSCWVMHFKPAKIHELLNISEDEIPVALLPMGYPAKDSAPMDLHSKFRDMNELVKYL